MKLQSVVYPGLGTIESIEKAIHVAQNKNIFNLRYDECR